MRNWSSKCRRLSSASALKTSDGTAPVILQSCRQLPACVNLPTERRINQDGAPVWLCSCGRKAREESARLIVECKRFTFGGAMSDQPRSGCPINAAVEAFGD